MTRLHHLAAFAFAFVCLACGASPRARPATETREPAPPRTEIRFASAGEGRALLGAEDSFTRRLGAFDRSLRLKRETPVSDAEHRTFAQQQARDFTSEERAAWAPALDELRAGIAGLDLGLPPVVLLVKTTGLEEFEAAYTRGNAIVLPAKMLAKPSSTLLAHELFHVSARTSPDRRHARYAILGFRPTKPIAPPPELEASRVTNPDAHAVDHYIVVESALDRREHAVIPVPICTMPLKEAIDGGRWFTSLRVKLVEIDPSAGAAIADATGKTRILDASDTDWEKRLARNTSYAIDPEEALADNFALLAKRRRGEPVDVKDPSVLDELERVLRTNSPVRAGSSTAPE